MRINVKLTAIALTGAIALFAAPSPTYATDNNQTKKTETKEIVVTIAEGDTLSSIADANKTTYVRIFNANENLSSPDAINAGD